ncbi:MAG: hypothetical protein A4E35_01008 [Methanoregula sp. PtaU1.Bin051]|nr:MAG: hypothetical protein A4E35_01008 [Methanoregula sp. PtaU1.Bin051]
MNTHFRTGMVVLITLLLAAALVASVSAAEERGVVRSDASEEQLKLINELYGKDITVLEYMEKVHPEHLAGIPDSIKKDMAGQKMNWWGKEPAPGQERAGREVQTDRATVSVSATGYTADWRTIHFSGTCTAYGLSSPPWYIYVEAFLINRDTGQTADSTSASGQNIWSVTASKDKYYPANGRYYVHAWGYIPTPYYAEDFDETGVFSFP